MRIILITMIFIIFSINYSYGDMQSDIKEIKQNMVTKAEFKMFMELVEKRFEAVDKRFEDMQKYMDKRFEDMNKRFEFIQSLLIALLITVLGSTIYSIIERKSFITKEELYKKQLKTDKIIYEIVKRDENLLKELKLAELM